MDERSSGGSKAPWFLQELLLRLLLQSLLPPLPNVVLPAQLSVLPLALGQHKVVVRHVLLGLYFRLPRVLQALHNDLVMVYGQTVFA